MKRELYRMLVLITVVVLMLGGCSLSGGKTEKQETGKNPQTDIENTVQPVESTAEKLSETAAEGNAETGEGQSAETVPGHSGSVVIVLDPGHGGSFTGAAYSSRVEKDMSLKLAGYLRDYLTENYGDAEVYLTREDDSELSADLVEDLELRAEFALQHNADALISLHFNAAEKHDINGATVYMSNRAHVEELSKKLSESILSQLTALGLKDNGVQKRNSNDLKDDEGKPLDYYAINRHCAARNIPGIIVEHCFMDNAEDESFIADDEALRKLAVADAEGIAECFELTHK